MIELAQDQTSDGYWVIYFKNGETSAEFYGVLHYIPQDGIYLKITIKNESKLVIDFNINNLEIDRIVGTTNNGTCYLFDAFLKKSESGGWITNFTIFANIASFARKIGQVVGEEYTVYDLKSDKENVFCKCIFEVEGLLPIIRFISNRSSIAKENKIFDFSILKNGSINHKNIEAARSYLNENCKIELKENIELKFAISYIESCGFDGMRRNNFSILSILSSKNKSISEFSTCSLNILRILRTVFDNNTLYIKHISANKPLVECTECGDINIESHSLFFNQKEFYDGTRKDFHNIPINNLVTLMSTIKESYLKIDKFIDVFKNTVKTDTCSVVDDIILLVKLIEGASNWLCDESCKPKINEELKSDLEKRLKGLPEMNNIINIMCNPGSHKQFFSVLESANSIISKELVDANEVSRYVYKIRSKESHGQINKHFRSEEICFDKLSLYQRYLRAVLYVQLFKRLNIDAKSIERCQSVLELHHEINSKIQ